MNSMDERVKALLPELPAERLALLRSYVALLLASNRRMNLISRSEEENVWENHVLPSLVALTMVDVPRGASVLDLGSGGGLPGIPLKIARPDLDMVLLDSIRKKTLFLRRVAAELALPKCAVLQQRLSPEFPPPELRGAFDLVTARAVAAVESLWTMAEPVLKSGGYLLAWKGRSDEPDLKRAADKLGFDYRILSVPRQLQGLSPKFTEMRLFQVFKRS